MISKPVLRTVIADQSNEFNLLKDNVPRSVFQRAVSYSGTSAFVIKGVRRCGKSTLLKQIVKARFKDDFLYFNFDDERIAGFETEDFQTLMETLIGSFGEKKNIFLDEIQNIHGWELFANRILRQGYRVFITGSNANLLSRELGTHLTGRHVDIELYPFSFTEFLKAQKVEVPEGFIYSTEQKALLSGKFKEYLSGGGMPEVVVFSNTGILTQIFNDIIQKDIISRYNIRKPAELKAVIKFLIANAANMITYRSITKNFGIQSPNTVQKYIEYTEETYLVFTVQRFERKLKKFDKNPRKVYCIDNGIITKNVPGIIERRGATLENIVAVQLKNLGNDFYYYKGETGAEADFVVPSRKQAIQVCYELNQQNRGREIKGLLEAAEAIRATSHIILTLEQEGEITAQNRKIEIKPVWQWLLENEPGR